MGYTTKFTGKFEINELPPTEVVVALNALDNFDGRDTAGTPGSYNGWQLTKDCRFIEWDGIEKFYYYVEWLEYICTAILEPAGLKLNGTVKYAGEDIEDVGILTVTDNVAVQKPVELITEEFEELKRFKDFVLKSQWKDEILYEWKSRT